MLRVADAQKITGFLRLPICPRAPRGLVRLPRPYLVAGRFATQNAEQAETRDQTPRGQILATSLGATSPHAAPRAGRAGRQEWMIVRGASARRQPGHSRSRRVASNRRIASHAAREIGGHKRSTSGQDGLSRAIARHLGPAGSRQAAPAAARPAALG